MTFYEHNMQTPQMATKQEVAGDFGFARASQRFRAAVVDLVFILIVTVVELFVTVPNFLTVQNNEFFGLTGGFIFGAIVGLIAACLAIYWGRGELRLHVKLPQ